MFRALTIAALAGSLAFTAGCNDQPGDYEIIMDVTGSAPAAVRMTIPTGVADDEKSIALPFRRGYVVTADEAAKGGIEVKVTPTKGAAACTITIDGKQTTKVEGKNGEPITCVGKIETQR